MVLVEEATLLPFPGQEVWVTGSPRPWSPLLEGPACLWDFLAHLPLEDTHLISILLQNLK